MKKQSKIALFALTLATFLVMTWVIISASNEVVNKGKDVLVGDSKAQGIRLTSEALDKEAYGAYSETAVGGVQVKAQVTPSDAYITSVTWSIGYGGENNTDVSEYITLHQSESDKYTVDVVVEQAFGTQMQLKVSVADCFGTEKSATCTVDYVGYLKHGLSKIYMETEDNETLLFLENYKNRATYMNYTVTSFEITPDASGAAGFVGTIIEDFKYEQTEYSIAPEYQEQVSAALGGIDVSKTYTFSLSDGIIPLKTFFDEVCDFANRTPEQIMAFNSLSLSGAIKIVHKGTGSISKRNYEFADFSLSIKPHDSFLSGIIAVESVAITGGNIIIV